MCDPVASSPRVDVVLGHHHVDRSVDVRAGVALLPTTDLLVCLDELTKPVLVCRRDPWILIGRHRRWRYLRVWPVDVFHDGANPPQPLNPIKRLAIADDLPNRL